MPTGDPITVRANHFVTLTQTLGGSFTIIVDGNMARVAGKDADALGLHVIHWNSQHPARLVALTLNIYGMP